MDTNMTPFTELSNLLNRTAVQIAESGTRSEAWTLTTMAEAARREHPGASAALVDWDGSEVARLRAFGIVHGAVLRDLTSRDQLRLLARILDGADLAAAG